MIRYHRYEVEGFEHLDTRRPALIAGYHGRPAAWDLCMLTVRLYERLGYLPHAIVHSTLMKPPGLKQFFEGIGAVPGDDALLAEAVKRGEHIVTTPGGVAEGTRSSLVKYRVHWGKRTGYVRLAIRYGLPIVPTAASGIDDTFIALNNGYKTARLFGLNPNLPLWIGVGPVGFSPWSPPFPVKIRQYVGEPITDTLSKGIDPADKDAVQSIHRKTTAAVQALLDRATSKEESK